ncbi:hypothetical protein T4B_14929 [Trichinella pseudospiralis]|uniref:Uncharacterized protein n=1 Tax=Trichinella pseudospiralis TaxID=6337 RepID=A0A0V1I061_TRIPS|nr:hypothetical protein T4B_14929 [Trichinella pseudospiralis]
MRLLCILIRSLRNATLRLRGVVIQLVPCATDPIRLSDLWRCLSYKDEEHPRAMLFGVEGDKTPLETQSMSGSQVAGRISSAFKSRRITEYIRFSLGRTWTELTKFFLLKSKRKNPKVPYEELDMKIGCGVEVDPPIVAANPLQSLELKYTNP